MNTKKMFNQKEFIISDDEKFRLQVLRLELKAQKALTYVYYVGSLICISFIFSGIVYFFPEIITTSF